MRVNEGDVRNGVGLAFIKVLHRDDTILVKDGEDCREGIGHDNNFRPEMISKVVRPHGRGDCEPGEGWFPFLKGLNLARSLSSVDIER